LCRGIDDLNWLSVIGYNLTFWDGQQTEIHRISWDDIFPQLEDQKRNENWNGRDEGWWLHLNKGRGVECKGLRFEGGMVEIDFRGKIKTCTVGSKKGVVGWYRPKEKGDSPYTRVLGMKTKKRQKRVYKWTLESWETRIYIFL